MNNKRSERWLILGCIAVVEAWFIAFQNRFKTTIKKVLETTNRMRRIFQELFGTGYGRKMLAKDVLRAGIIVLCLLAIVLPASALNKAQQTTTDLLKETVGGILDWLAYPVAPVCAFFAIAIYYAESAIGDEDAALNSKVLKKIKNVLIFEVVVSIFWTLVNVAASFGPGNN